jgi:hypothetical protein
VVDINEKTEKYFVHYLGWNIRYDEWIFRGRIAENLSLRENYQSKAQGKGPAIAQPHDSPSSKEGDKEDGKERKGKKRGRSVTPAPPGTILSTPIVVESPVPVITIPVPPSSAGTRSKTANLSGSIKRKRNSTDTKEDLPVKKKRSYKKSDKSMEGKLLLFKCL